MISNSDPWRNWQSAFCAEYGLARFCCTAYRALTCSQRLRDELKQTYCLIVENMYKCVKDQAAIRTVILGGAFGKGSV